MERKSKFGPFLVGFLITLSLVDIVIFKPDLVDELRSGTRWETQIILCCFIVGICGLIIALMIWATDACNGEALHISQVKPGTVFKLMGVKNDGGTLPFHAMVRHLMPVGDTSICVPIDTKVHTLLLTQLSVPREGCTVVVVRNWEGQNVLVEYPLPDTAIELQVAIQAAGRGA